MDNVKLEVYPTIEQALESLNPGECLYTKTNLIYNPLKSFYKKDGEKYRVISSTQNEGSEEIEKFISKFTKNMDKYIPDWRRNLGYVKNEPLKLIEEIKTYYFDEPNTYWKDSYWIYFFRMEDFDEFRRDIVSSIKENAGVLPEPVEEAALLGLGEEFEKYKKKEFISIGVFKKFYSENNYWANSEIVKRIIERLMSRENWKEEVVKNVEVEDEVIRKIMVEVETPYIKRYKVDIKRYRATLTISDKPIESLDERAGKHIIGRIWESGRLVNIDGMDINELGKLLLSKPFKEGIKKSYPEVIGSVVIDIDEKPLGLVAVPIAIELGNGKDLYEVEFLVMIKSKILEKNIIWSKTVGYKELNSPIAGHKINSKEEEFSMIVKDTREGDLRLIEERWSLDGGKKIATLKLKSKVYVEVSREDEDSEFSETLPKIYTTYYIADLKEEKLVVVFDIDKLGNVNIEEHEKIEKLVKGKESLVVETRLLGKCGFRRLKNEYSKEIENDIREIIRLIEDLEKREESQERKARLKIGKMLVKKSEELIKDKLGIKVSCKCVDNFYGIKVLRCEANSSEEDKRRIDFKEEVIEAIKEIQTSAARESKVAKNMSGYFRLLINQDPRNLELCYENPTGRKSLNLFNLDKTNKELHYVRTIKEILETSFKEYLENLRREKKSDVISPYIDNLSTGIAASMLSVSSRFFLEEVIPAFLLKGEERLSREEMETIYSKLFSKLSMGCYSFDSRTKSWNETKQGIGEKYCKEDRIKRFIEKVVAIDMRMSLLEKVNIVIGGYNKGKEPKAILKNFASSQVSNEITFYLKSRSEGKLLGVVI